MQDSQAKLFSYIQMIWTNFHHIQPQVLHFHPTASLLLLPDLTDDLKHWIANHLLSHLAETPETQAIIFISEAWAVKLPKDTNLDDIPNLPRASQHPDRTEIINAMVYTPDYTTMLTWEINRTTHPPTISAIPHVTHQPRTSTLTPTGDPSLFHNPFPPTAIDNTAN